MKSVNISVNVRNNPKTLNLVLFQKIYSTPYGIVNHWTTDNNQEYRLEVIVDEDDISINPSKISKSMNILNNEWEIADKMMIVFYEQGNFYKKKLNNSYL